MKYSVNWIMWRAFIKHTTCLECATRNGRIFSYDDLIRIGEPQLHPNCGCRLERIETIQAGMATALGANGADWWIKYLNKLPDYYIDRNAAMQAGWNPFGGNLREVLPGYMIFGGIYKNKRHQLPEANERIWYEADINYTGGYRNKQRLLFSNDGLIFVTFDHYETFAEIIGED